jgi:hypothetical protein
MTFNTVTGGYQIRTEDERVITAQRAITKRINDNFIQIGACFLKMSSKNPIDEDWAKMNHRDTNLQDWIDDPDFRFHNLGFNLQLGWMDIDIDVEDPEYNECLLAALDHLGVDTRFRFGRRSVGFPTHVLVQLTEGEANNFEHLKKFEPKEFRIGGKRYKTQLRSFPTNTEKANVLKAAQQTVVPGSIYSHKSVANEYDLSVWYQKDGKLADSVSDVAATTPRRASFSQIIRAIAFATLLYVVRDKWVEGERQNISTKIAGWLARVVAESQAMNNHEVISADVFCPIDDDSVVESLFEFIGGFMGDEEVPMRIRTYYDAQGKLQRNPDAKIPGWPSMEATFGGEVVQALRAVFTPGSDVSILTVMAERYVYDETDNVYIDRRRHLQDGSFTHGNDELTTRHKGDVVRIGGKPREAFKVFESSDMRKRVDRRDLYPDLDAGQIYRIGLHEEILPDEIDEDGSMVIFNTWRGWPIAPAAEIDTKLMEECVAKLDQLLAYVTQDNPDQALWFKRWVAWTFQNPGRKQQIAPVVVGGQGVGKSFLGNVFLNAIMGRLWGTASPKVMEGGFSVEPFIDKMFVFIDEAKFHGDASTDEIKKIIRNIDIGGAEKFGHARNYRIFSRVMFASNRFDLGVGQAGLVDRALFYIKTYDREYKKMSEFEFQRWAETLKPWFEEYAEFMARRTVREHYVRYFMDLPVTKQQVESLQHSAVNDPVIVTSNMTWPRRIAKRIIEEGRILEMTALEVPFLSADLDRRVAELTQEMGLRSVQGSRVLQEFEGADLIEKTSQGMRRYLKFKHKLGTTTQLFGAAIGVELDSMFEFGENDYGENTAEIGARMNWRGMKDSKF